MERKQISFKVKKAIFERDRYRCVCCGATNKDKQLEVDHIIPVSREGTNDFDNLATLCISCNRGKSDELIRINAIKNKLTEYLDKIQAENNRKNLEKLRDDHKEIEEPIIFRTSVKLKEMKEHLEKQLPQELQAIRAFYFDKLKKGELIIEDTPQPNSEPKGSTHNFG